jgi:hypothetical protein
MKCVYDYIQNSDTSLQHCSSVNLWHNTSLNTECLCHTHVDGTTVYVIKQIITE